MEEILENPLHKKQGRLDLRNSIARQRELLSDMLKLPLQTTADLCAEVWPDRELLDQALMSSLGGLPYCKFLYALDTNAQQISDNASQEGLLTEHFGRDRATRPYMVNMVPTQDFLLSSAYMSLRAHRPSVTAVQLVRKNGEVVGFIGADFDLRDLPLTSSLYEETRQWRQVKGDPSIRSNVLFQTRVESPLDRSIDDAHAIIQELFTAHGMFHTQVHYSSSQAIIWLRDDPYRYRLLDVRDLMDPEICFAYPTSPYPKDAVVPRKKIKAILQSFKVLRFGDENIYLRSGSINIFNGLIGLNFSCDGSHYIPFDEFLEKDTTFWGMSA